MTTHTIADINTKSEGDCGYVAAYAGSGKPKVGIYAPSLYAATVKAREHFKVPKSKIGLVSVMIAERRDGTVVEQSTAQF